MSNKILEARERFDHWVAESQHRGEYHRLTMEKMIDKFFDLLAEALPSEEKSTSRDISPDQGWVLPEPEPTPTSDDHIFIKHIQSHLEPEDEVICKICEKTAKQIISEYRRRPEPTPKEEIEVGDEVLYPAFFPPAYQAEVVRIWKRGEIKFKDGHTLNVSLRDLKLIRKRKESE